MSLLFTQGIVTEVFHTFSIVRKLHLLIHSHVLTVTHCERPRWKDVAKKVLRSTVTCYELLLSETNDSFTELEPDSMDGASKGVQSWGNQMDEVLHHTKHGMLDKGPLDFTVMMDEVPMTKMSEDGLITAKAKALFTLHFFSVFGLGGMEVAGLTLATHWVVGAGTFFLHILVTRDVPEQGW